MLARISPTAVALALALPLCAAGAQEPVPPPAGRVDSTMVSDSAARADSMVAVRKGAVKWAALEQPGFASGLQLAVLAGDPAQPGPYTIRLKFPAGYTFPAHWHPKDENLTVLSGTFLLGMGERRNRAALKRYGPGDYLLLPATMPHFGGVGGATVIQLHGVGPFEIKLVEPAVGAAR